jgi:hypothetical protein
MIKGWLTAVSAALIFILLGIVCSVAYSPLSNASESSLTIQVSAENTSDINSSAELLYFVERLLTYPSYPLSKSVAILPGELPRNLSVDISIPSDAAVIGSLVRYEDTYEGAGWNETENFYLPERSGFISSVEPESVIFCRYEDKGPSIEITAHNLATAAGNVSDVRLHVDTDPQTWQCTKPSFEPYGDDRAEIIPPLKAPEGAMLGGGSSGGGKGRWQVGADIETELNVSELSTHYQKQLLEADWVLNDGGDTDTIAWSTWSFTDESGDLWSGFFLVSEGGRENTRFLYLMVHACQ